MSLRVSTVGWAEQNSKVRGKEREREREREEREKALDSANVDKGEIPRRVVIIQNEKEVGNG